MNGERHASKLDCPDCGFRNGLPIFYGMPWRLLRREESRSAGAWCLPNPLGGAVDDQDAEWGRIGALD